MTSNGLALYLISGIVALVLVLILGLCFVTGIYTFVGIPAMLLVGLFAILFIYTACKDSIAS